MAQRFVHRASAVPFSGEITRPFSDVLDAQASTSLSPDGGSAFARIEGFRHREVVSFDAAYSQVVGSRDGAGSNETLALAVVEGLNILDMVTADRVVARLTSSQPAAAKAEDELPMLALGSYFVNLRIAGIPIELSPRADLIRKAKKSEMESLQTTSKTERHLVFSVFDEKALQSLSSCAGINGARIEIPDFGAVTLGELIVTEHSRRLTMVRAELGSPIGGRMTAAAVEGDGFPF